MKYILKLSGEHPSLPLAELSGVLEAEGLDYFLSDIDGGLVLVDVKPDGSDFIHRLALTTNACEYVAGGCDLSVLAEIVYDRIRHATSFAVRSKSETLEKKFGEMLFNKGLKVNLKNPEVEVNLFKVDGGYMAGLDIPLKRDFNSRRAQYRPFFSPTSMHPKLARTMVNLARVSAGETVLDPFCGTGGILIEAGLMGVKPVGWDISEKMVGGCRQNLSYFRLKGDIAEQNALEYKGRLKVDAIVTDPPYGRASYTSDKEVDRLYTNFISKSHKLVKKGGYVILMLPSSKKINPKGFHVKGYYDVRVHKSLTRRIWVIKKTT